jgi:hypothetical protein
MAETKYGKYILTELKKKLQSPYETTLRPEDQTEILFLDNEVIEGACVVDTVWFWPARANKTESDVEPHKHDHDEILAIFGTNPDDPHDLCGELEVWLEDEKHIITKSAIIFIPKGLRHGPIRFTRLEKPVFHFGVSLSKKYS